MRNPSAWYADSGKICAGCYYDYLTDAGPVPSLPPGYGYPRADLVGAIAAAYIAGSTIAEAAVSVYGAENDTTTVEGYPMISVTVTTSPNSSGDSLQGYSPGESVTLTLDIPAFGYVQNEQMWVQEADGGWVAP